VFADLHAKLPNFNCVDINYFQCGYKLASHLIEKGHRRIMYFAPNSSAAQENERLSGVLAALEENNMSPDDLRLFTAADPYDTAADAADLLKNCQGCTAIIASWITMGFDLLNSAADLGLSVPDDIAVTVLGYSPYAQYTRPRLTSLDLPFVEMGRKSAEILMGVIAGEKSKTTVSLNADLIAGKSS